MNKNKKREIPLIIRNTLDLDIRLTKVFAECIEDLKPMRKLKAYYKILEISCHGIIWLALSLAFIWILNSKNLYQVQINLITALLLDIIIIAILKALTGRKRPAHNNDPLSIGPDKYAFPSGHASRSMLIFYFFTYIWPVSAIFLTILLMWVFAVVISRILMRRHHILDVCVGLLVGYAEGMLMSILYLNDETCLNLVSWLINEKMAGAEYDV
ncbi:phospholipid phosphatase 6 isoform X2 [Apis florea]|uniref:phospholipid phosphatase 6 isoform X2 n=1 Tax=Apis florea TaxID=7463 RepID=UPI000252BC99|nr:phospholipid phosphatase 6 isoform X2 [Apis florea]